MAVDVEHGGRHGAQARKPGLFARLAQRHRQQVGIAVGVAAGLQPLVELAVVREQHAAPWGVHDPRRSREVARRTGAQQAVGMGLHEADDFGGHGRLMRIGGARLMGAQQAKDGGAVHGLSERPGKPGWLCRG